MASNLIVCGGTFDHFHKGHESLLKLAFSSGDKVIIGVTSDAFVEKSKIPTSLKLRGAGKNQKSKLIEDFKTRRRAVLEFAKSERVLGKVEIVEINDLFGLTLSKDLLIGAIVVSEETKKGAEIINARRRELGLKDLNILIAPQVLAEDGKLISSERIRNGEINRAGRPYVNPLWFETDLILPEDLRQEFKEPLGSICEDRDLENLGQNLVITVGDATAKKFNEKSIKQNLSVIDFRIAREDKFSAFSELGFQGDEEIVMVNNPAGHITSSLFSGIAKISESGFSRRIILKVAGEEDLAVLPLILLSPLGASIYYGQPPLRPAFAKASSGRQGFAGQAGLVKVTVSEESKEKAYNLVSKLKRA